MKSSDSGRKAIAFPMNTGLMERSRPKRQLTHDQTQTDCLLQLVLS